MVQPVADQAGDEVREIQYRCRNAGADVEHRGIHSPQRHAAKQCGDHVRHVDEVARLTPVSLDDDGDAAADPLAEDGDDPGVGGAWILAGAVDVEEAETAGGDAMHVAGDFGV